MAEAGGAPQGTVRHDSVNKTSGSAGVKGAATHVAASYLGEVACAFHPQSIGGGRSVELLCGNRGKQARRIQV